jgi:hypothetical protein
MAPHIRCQTILIPATRSGVVEQGFLVFADDVLMAVVMYLDKSVEADLRRQWFLETSYGSCTVPPGSDVLFQTPDEAQSWVLQRVTRARENQGPQLALSQG